MPDGSVAAVLNRMGRRTGKGHSWTEMRVRTFRAAHKIEVYREGELAERGELRLGEAARELGVSQMTVLRLIQRGVLPAVRACKGSPWVIRKADLGLEGVKLAVRAGLRLPATAGGKQMSLEFQ